jgi:CIC family chloride channel protein
MSTQAAPPARQLHPLGQFAWAIAVGAVAGLGAVVFRGLIALFHNLLFLGQWSFDYNANVHTPAGPWEGAWTALVILVPVLGAVGVAFLVSNFAPEAKGHGVPEVMDAIYYNRGVIRPVVAVIKSLASALSIGSGGSVGREGPIVQIGSSFASTLGQWLRLPVWQRISLIGAGAGAGIAATFNTPVGGVLFAVEIILHEVSARTLVPVAIATATASYIGRLVFGYHTSFKIPEELQGYGAKPTDLYVLLFYPVLGVLLGMVSVAYIRSIYLFEDYFDRIPGGYYVRHVLGMLMVGIVLYVLMRTTGHYYVEGVGYATVEDVLRGEVVWFLLPVLFLLKLLTTSLTLGSGASGGVFSPALFLGATFGGAFGLAAKQLFPALPVDPAAFAVAGMAGVVGGSTGAAMTAVVMIYEMTMDYQVIIPMTLTVALSHGIRKLLQPQSIYTLKLARRGHDIPDALQANPAYLNRTRQVMDRQFAAVPADGTMDDFARLAAERPDVSCFLVEGPEGVAGFLTRDRALRPPGPEGKPGTLADCADRRFVTVGEDMPLLEVMSRMRAAGASVALVADGSGVLHAGSVRGLIAKEQIAAAVIDSVGLFSD